LPVRIGARIVSRPCRAWSDTMMTSGESQSIGNRSSGQIPMAASPVQEKRECNPGYDLRPARCDCHELVEAGGRGRERSQEIAGAEHGGRTVEKGRVAKTKYWSGVRPVTPT